MPIACQEQLNSPGRQLQCESHLGAKLLPDHHTHVTVKLPTLHSKATYIKSVLTECLKKKKRNQVIKSKFIKLYTFHTCRLLYVNDASLNLVFKKCR